MSNIKSGGQNWPVKDFNWPAGQNVENVNKDINFETVILYILKLVLVITVIKK